LKNSLFRRLVLGFSGAFFILILFSNLALYFLLVRNFETERRTVLNDRVDALTSLLKTNSREEIVRRVVDEWPKRGGEKVYLEVLAPNSQPIAETPGLPNGVFENENDAFLLRSRQVDGGTIRAAIGNEQGREILSHYRAILFTVLGFSVFFSLILARQVARSGMAPLIRIAEKIRGVGSETLHQRLELEGLPVELQGIAQAFNHSLDRLEESFGRLSRFSADIAHELRTPLSNINAEIEIALTRTRADQDYREVLSSTLEECSRLTQMIESLLFLARAEDLKHGLKTESLELRPEIEGMLEFYEASAAEKNLRTYLDIQGELKIRAERVLFQRALGNLISNAIRYTPSGGALSIRCVPDGTNVQIHVRDTGPGIPQQHIDRIFERFYRIDPSRTPNGGFGLGLAIVKSAVELHGGRVIAKSSDQGTEMTLIWPMPTA
jgi:two-component system, OmpR family, heavy metal sensor histidine kinase CusS